MKWFSGFACILTLTLLVDTVSAQPQPPVQHGRCSADSTESTSVITTGEYSYVFVQAGRAYEVLEGSRAFQYLSDKRLRHPQRFFGMGSALSARGYRPTDTIFVERSLKPEEARDILGDAGPRLISPRRASTTYSNWQGEQIFWSWDDGNDGTWEGSQYVERYSDGAWVTFDGQLDISNTNGDAIWGVRTGGGGGLNERNQVSHPGVYGPGSVRLAGWNELNKDFRDWAVCITGGCLGCAGGCLFTGPAYPVCYGSCCFGVSIACAIDFYF